MSDLLSDEDRERSEKIMALLKHYTRLVGLGPTNFEVPSRLVQAHILDERNDLEFPYDVAEEDDE